MHLDNKDAGQLLNLINSIGLDSNHNVVQLKGCLLMFVALFADTNLAGVALPGGLAHAHDMYGNIVLLEPSSSQVVLPKGLVPQQAPKRESSVKLAMKEGRTVLLFFKSGGAIATQLAHHWHAVVSEGFPMSPPPAHQISPLTSSCCVDRRPWILKTSSTISDVCVGLSIQR
tara:strand:- start:246 stop:761 length:516 start_codon:yes stop_codon:yes gene_type:complete